MLPFSEGNICCNALWSGHYAPINVIPQYGIYRGIMGVSTPQVWGSCNAEILTFQCVPNSDGFVSINRKRMLEILSGTFDYEFSNSYSVPTHPILGV